MTLKRVTVKTVTKRMSLAKSCIGEMTRVIYKGTES